MYYKERQALFREIFMIVDEMDYNYIDENERRIIINTTYTKN